MGLISSGTYKSCLGCCKMNRSLPLDPRILQVSIEALPLLSHMYYPGLLNNTLLSQGCIIGTGSCEQNAHPRTGEGWGASDCLGPAQVSSGVTSNINYMYGLRKSVRSVGNEHLGHFLYFTCAFRTWLRLISYIPLSFYGVLLYMPKLMDGRADKTQFMMNRAGHMLPW